MSAPWSVATDGSDVWVANEYDTSVTELSARTGVLVRVISGSAYGFYGPISIATDGTDV